MGQSKSIDKGIYRARNDLKGGRVKRKSQYNLSEMQGTDCRLKNTSETDRNSPAKSLNVSGKNF